MEQQQLIDGRYRLLGPLGEGGEARVFRAHDLQRGEEVAVRLPRSASLERMETPTLEFHPGWAKALGSGIDPKCGAYQIFEFLEGESLRQKVPRAPLTETELMSFIPSIAGGGGGLACSGLGSRRSERRELYAGFGDLGLEAFRAAVF